MARRPEKTSGPLLDQSGETVGYFEEYGIYRSEIRESDPRPPSLPGSAFVRKLRQLGLHPVPKTPSMELEVGHGETEVYARVQA
jgi:hypothetical protein